MNLFYRELGSGDPLIILHGLMGSSDNWVTLGKIFAEEFRVFIIDQRNHGQSFHTDDFNYDLLTRDLKRFIDDNALEKVSLIGHSMGGKVVMKYALENAARTNRLIVADMAPKAYEVDYDLIFKALNAVDLSVLQSRSEAEKIVAQYIEDFGMRQFLLKNLSREGNGYQWKANLKAIQKNIQMMGHWSTNGESFEGPTLFINGSESGYVKEEDNKVIGKLFPKAERSTLKAGHWLHAEKPQEFMDSALHFLRN